MIEAEDGPMSEQAAVTDEQEPEPLATRQQLRHKVRDLEARLAMTANEAAKQKQRADHNAKVGQNLQNAVKEILETIMATCRAIWPTLNREAAMHVAELYRRAAPQGSPLPGAVPGLALVEGGRVRG